MNNFVKETAYENSKTYFKNGCNFSSNQKNSLEFAGVSNNCQYFLPLIFLEISRFKSQN